MNPDFLQLLLATNANSQRLWQLFEGAEAAFTSGLPESDWPGLTETERRNAAKAQPVLPTADCIRLEQSDHLPPGLFCLGDPACLKGPKVGIVGTRGMSPYGQAVAIKFASEIALSGCVVVSGGAIGIDSCAHEAAIAANGKTICVLPCGVDVTYPPRHKSLFQKIQESGCLLSQFSCGTRTSNDTLLRRNHTIAGLSDLLIVIEAPLKSGSLITAQAAQNLGKPVFAVPGPISQESFRGSHALMRQGARLIDDPSQALEELGLDVQKRASKQGPSDPDQVAVLGSLDGIPRQPETLTVSTGLSVEQVLTALTMLEIDGFAERTPQGYALKL